MHFRISHNSTPKPDILSSLMNSNMNNMGNNAIAKPPTSTLHNPYSPTGNNSSSTSSDNNWQQNSWHSANPLVMNHQLPAPTVANTTASTTPNNNFSSLDDLDPFGSKQQQQKQPMSAAGTTANSYTLQKPTVDYIYPPGYNNIKANSNTPLMGINNAVNMNAMASMSAPLMPQSSMNSQQTQDSRNLNTLSQQDILSFLN